MMENNSPSVTIPLKTPIQSNEHFRNLFNKFDRDKDGYITYNELISMAEHREYAQDLPLHCIRKIHKLYDCDRDQRLDFQEFLRLIHNRSFAIIFEEYLTNYIHFVVPAKGHPPSRSATDGAYEELYSCYPPAVGMIIISLVEIIFFCIDEATEKDSTRSATGPTATLFIYDPYKRSEVWRYITYMFVHIGVFHLFVNLMVQILLGIPLEMVHKWWRVLVVYFAGVLAGSLATSIADPYVKLAGASGGVYSLITAHVASIIMNWKEMAFPLAQLMVFIIVTATDVGTAIYYRYVLDKVQSIGYVAHFAGAVAGLLVGINLLRNLSVTRTERIIWWVSIVLYTSLMTMCIFWNLFWSSYFPMDPFEGRVWQNYALNSTKSNFN